MIKDPNAGSQPVLERRPRVHGGHGGRGPHQPLPLPLPPPPLGARQVRLD